jgi:predicted amidohydrolase
VSHYRKVNLATGENAFFTAGDSFAPVVNVDGVRVGVLICFDVYLPEPARLLSLQQAQLLVIPTANGYPYPINTISDLMIPTRAMENNVVVAYTNWVQDISGSAEYLRFHGQTKVSDWGGNSLYAGPAGDAALQVVSFNITAWPGPSTAFSRPAADLKGLCDN